jgi:type 1 glutamine amidotransferase
MRLRFALVLAVAFCCTRQLRAAEIDPYDQSKIPLEVDTTDPKLAKIVLVAGIDYLRHPSGSHEYVAGMALMMDVLKQTPGVFPVVARDAWPKDEKIFDNARAIVFYSQGGPQHTAVRKGHLELLQRQMDRGVGLVNIHWATDYPPETQEQTLKWTGCCFDFVKQFSKTTFWEADFNVLPEHPVTRGVTPFKVSDEWYVNMRYMPGMKGITSILKAKPPKGAPGGAPDDGLMIAWTYERENGGRSFGTTLGHTHRNWQNEQVRRVVANAILWCAKMDVPAAGAKVDIDEAALNRNLEPKQNKGK